MKSCSDSIMQLLLGREDFGRTPQVNWGMLYPHFRHNGLTPWIYSEYGAMMDEPFRKMYHSDFVLNSLINEVLLTQAKRLEASFGESLTRLKGVALAALIYDGQGTRVFYDVDYFIPQNQIGDVIDHLLAMGYRKSIVKEWSATRNRTNFFKTTGGQIELNFDLHTQLFWESKDEVVWRTIWDLNLGFRHLSHEDQFFHLIVNWAFQDTFVGLNKFLDISLMWKRFSANFDEERLMYLIKVHGYDRVFQIVFSLIERFFGLSTKHYRQNLDPTSEWITRLPDSDFLMSPRSHLLKYFTLKHLTKSSLTQSVRYDLGWTFARLRGIFSS